MPSDLNKQIQTFARHAHWAWDSDRSAQK